MSTFSVPVRSLGTSTTVRGTWRPGCSCHRHRSIRCHASSPIRAFPVAGVMFDVIPFRHPERYQHDQAVRRRIRLRASLARSLDAVLAISEFSATTAIDELRLHRGARRHDRHWRVGTVRTARATDHEDGRRRRHRSRRPEEHPSSDRRMGETSARSPPASSAVRGGRSSSECARAVAAVGGRCRVWRHSGVHRRHRRHPDGASASDGGPVGDAVDRRGIRPAGCRGGGVWMPGDLLRRLVPAGGDRRAGRAVRPDRSVGDRGPRSNVA